MLLVPASLVFVGMQMRQTHAIERGNAQRDLLNQTRDWWMTCVRDRSITATSLMQQRIDILTELMSAGIS